MEHIWAPWRMKYIQMKKPEGCILCDKPGEDNDAVNYILHRGDRNFVIMNSYPYNPGHLMISPFRHIASLEELTDDERVKSVDATVVMIDTDTLAVEYDRPLETMLISINCTSDLGPFELVIGVDDVNVELLELT